MLFEQSLLNNMFSVNVKMLQNVQFAITWVTFNKNCSCYGCPYESHAFSIISGYNCNRTTALRPHNLLYNTSKCTFTTFMKCFE